jgi:L-ribulose-5-phosphate 4-epimerase
MLLPDLRKRVLDANLELQRQGLVLYTFGNASGIDRASGLVVIKPSGVPYESMKIEDLVITDLDCKIVEGTLNPSSDLETHVLLYREFPTIGGVVHTHSEFATSWAQACKAIPCFGTTHADYFNGEVPVTEPLSDEEIEGEYERNTGAVIVRRFQDLDPLAVPGVLVGGHAPFTWGKSPEAAAYTAVVLEYIAKLAFRASLIQPRLGPVSPALLRRHYERKHGAKATYGQRDSDRKN